MKRADSPHITYSPRSDATPEAERSTLAAVYAYLMNTHNSKKAAECAATSDDRDGSTSFVRKVRRPR